jgi:hypothetical protein
MNPVYIDDEGYVVKPIERRDMYEEDEMLGYDKVSIWYAGNQPVGGSAPSLPPTIPTTLPAYPLSSRGPLRAPMHGKDRQPAPTPNYQEDVYSFEPPESSATKNLPNVEDSAPVP